MARNETFIAASPEAVFDVLADPRTYAQWVFGTHRVRAADPEWPVPGACLDHVVGIPPLLIADSTSVMRALPPRLLELRARARPLPDARVTVRLQAEEDGTWATIVEEPVHPVLNLLTGPVGHALLRLRNRESLRRLKGLAEGTIPRPTDPLPARS